MRIKTLKLHNFRNLENVSLHISDAPIIVLYGENGAGKTSILEGISLLSPGRGLHRLKMDSHIKHGHKEWTVYTELEGNSIQTVGMQFKSGKRHIKIDDEKNKTQNDLSTLGNVLWFTPKMDRLFMDSTSARREFLDRLVFGHFKNHATNLNRLKHHLKNRIRLLKDQASSEWIDIEEEQAALFAEKVSITRTQYLEELKNHLTVVNLSLTGSFERYEDKSAAFLQQKLKHSRERDLKAGATLSGPQRNNLEGTLNTLNIPLSECSTGQHKRAILEILLANARLTAEKSGNTPIILLDEVAGHLDQKTKNYFLDEITKLGCQIWLTGTEKESFDSLQKAQFICIHQGKTV